MAVNEMKEVELTYDGQKFIGVNADVDFSEGHTVTKFFSYDDDRTYEAFVPRYSKKKVNVPVGISDEFIGENINRLWGGEFLKAFNLVPVELLNQFAGTGIYGDALEACLVLLTSNLRSEFRKSLRNQLLNWLNDGEYETPFSAKQWNCLFDNQAMASGQYRRYR